MNLFPSSPRNLWHRQLISSGAHLALFNTLPWSDFPLDEVKRASDAYVNRMKLIPDTQQCDAKLIELIVEHSQRERGGLKDVAVLSCLHLLSRDAGSGMLVALRDECAAMPRPDNPRFLRCLMLAYLSNALLVSAEEYRTAEALMRLLADPNFLGSVHNLFQTMEGLVHPTILSASYISTILESMKFQAIFQHYLDEFQETKKYMSLHNAVSWLRPMTTLQSTSTAKAVCTTLIPHWEYWTAWKPNYLRLMNWEGGSFTDDQRRRLHRVFDLESPDTSGYGFPARKHSVPGGCFQLVSVVNSELALLEHVLVLLDAAQKIPGKSAVELFLFLLIENRNPVDRDLLSLTETILETKNDSCIHAVRVWLSNLGGSSNNNRMSALKKLLPALERRRALQEKLGSDIANDVIQAIHAAKIEYADTRDIAENLALAIHGLANAVLDAAWLRQILDRFDKSFVQSLRRFPPEEVMHNMFNSLQRSGAPVRQIQEYLGIVFGGKPGDAEVILSSIQRTIRFWAPGVHSDRANLALAVNGLEDIDDAVLEACLKHILVEDIQVVSDLLRILRTGTNKSRVQFHSRVHLARLLARRRRLPAKPPVDQCWLTLLFSLILPKGQEIMAWSAQELPVAEWYQWLADLKLLFPYGDRLSMENLGISQSQSSWWDLLLTKYDTAVVELEKLHKVQGTSLKWLWFKEAEYITDLLDLLQRRDNLSPFHRFLVSIIKQNPSSYAIQLVCTSLAAANRATPQGQIAFQSIYVRHKKQNPHGWWPRSATEALMIAWRQSNEITDHERDGLGAFSALLGLGPDVDSSGLHFARQSMLSDHARIISTAQELEQMRSNLQNDDTTRTTAFLGELGVEDARPGADPSIPGKLSSVVEAVGDRQYEMCFPLSHLNPHERRAAGIDEAARLLLVRISFQPREQSFCVHFHPNEDGSDRTHVPWYLGGDAPDGKVCGTRPTLFTYLLNRALCSFLTQGARDLVSVHDMISSILKAPAANCIVCSRSMRCKLWRPTVCSDSCGETFQRAPLEVRTCHLINDPPILDLLLNCVYAAAADTSTLDLLPGCPIPKANVRNVVDSFPRLIANTSAAQLLSLIRGGGDAGAAEREQLLLWMSIRFRGCLISASAGLRVPSMPGVVQFMMLNAAPEREQAFSHYVTLGGTNVAGGVTFHGTSVDRMWRILTEGLKNMGGTQYVAHTDPGGPSGISLADEAALSMGYSGSTEEGWQKTAFPNRTVLLVCELVGHSRQGVHVVSEEARVAVRYVLLCPSLGGGFTPPATAGEVSEVVKRNFTAIRTGELGRTGVPVGGGVGSNGIANGNGYTGATR